MPQRYFLEENKGLITGQDAHHIKQVMRMKTGDIIIVCVDGACFESSITIHKDEVSYEIIKTLKNQETLDITLFQGMPKGNKIEITLKYATMYGIAHLVLVDMKRSIQGGKPSEQKQKRYHMIMKEASELSHRFSIPTLEYIEGLENVKWNRYDLILLADEDEKTTTLNDAIPEHLKSLKIALIIGPEGGIDLKERVYLKQHNAKFISLGSNILSSEIASLYALSILNSKIPKCFDKQ
ncbi:MAG: RsmE family RNA methyltransferase [Acholeplasmataceae bacterium]|nr:16S rRNA (uracil(1498)-N(3))-methyltransferase [Acholeplasmataceae bacterium]